MALRKRNVTVSAYDLSALYGKIYGAWTGRICGCMLGKSIECIRTNELTPFLKESGNYPMHRYIYRSDLTDEVLKKYTFCFSERQYADEIDAVAATTSDTETILLGGLSEIPSTSRLYEGVMSVVEGFRAGVSRPSCFDKIHAMYDEYSDHEWTHTIPNAMIVAAALLYGGGDFGKSICMAVETGFDADCNVRRSVLFSAWRTASIPFPNTGKSRSTIRFAPRSSAWKR